MFKNAINKPSAIGNTSGRRLLCSPGALPVFNNLIKLAKSGNHWASLVVQGITGLSSGRLHLDNIYIEKRKSLAYGKGAFHIVLPGVTASLEEHPDGSYILQTIKTDHNYQQLQKEGDKPGLWRIDKNIDARPSLQQDGTILSKEYRPVVITDMAENNADKIARISRKDLIKTDGTIKNMVRDYGFDMHHTPGDSGIIGLKNAKNALATAKDSDITQSATLLANTMFQARKINGVLWYSDWGGSAVLTRAMEILHHEKNISLNNHAIFMHRPTSKTKYALELGKKLGLRPNADGMKTGLHPKELAGNILVSDIGATKKTLSGALNTTAFGVSAAGASLALAGASATVSGVLGVAGALFFVSSAVKSGTSSLKGKQYK